MFRRAAGHTETDTLGSASYDSDESRLADFLILSAWCGMVAGLLEVGSIVLRKETYDPNHLYWMSRQFVWLIPVTNLCLFLALGLGLCVVRFAWRRRGHWLAMRLLCTLTLLPAAVMAVRQIYDWAWLLVSMGLAARWVPLLERYRAGFRRLVQVSFPVAAGLVAILAASMWAGDRIKERREAARPLPPPDSPNVLLIVLDTVGADHLSLYGYPRPTSPTLDELAGHGIRFDSVQAAAPWTLPSHAVMLTCKLPHELTAGWLTPLDAAAPTLAEFLGSQGYATAGFVANKWYCASDSGLGRGFTVYRDYLFPKLTAFGMAALVSRPTQRLPAVADFLDGQLGTDLFWRMGRSISGLFNANRIDGAMIGRLFLNWLSARSQPERPFFAFLNLSDAHDPYQLPELGLHRFGVRPRTSRDVDLILNWTVWDKRGLPARDLALVRDSYDSCIAYVDEQLGRLIDELERRGVLETTWVIIAADHGESFGEHAGVFWHGTSLYRTELHVPLVILPPTQSRSQRVVTERVSLRDMAATIVDLTGSRSHSHFPGRSLARFWQEPAAGPPASDRALAEVVPNDPSDPDPARLLKPRWPLGALTEGDWTYIRREGHVHEELFHWRNDAQEQHNLASDPTLLPVLDRMRAALNQLTAGPLTPHRFRP